MKLAFFTTALGAATLAVAGSLVSIAHAADQDPNIVARQAIMKTFKDGMGPLGGMAKGAFDFDADVAKAAIARMIEANAQTAQAFEANVMDDKTEALPAIWTNWNDFIAKADDLEFALEAWDVSDLDALRAGMGNVGAACGACHKEYRVKKN